MKIRMLRNVLVEGKHCAAGEVVEVEEAEGKLLVQWQRAEAVTGDEEAGGTPAIQEVETATRAGGKRRGQK